MAIDKNTALGMNVSTANHQLKKLLMFQMMQRLGDDKCHQCNEVIESAAQLSVEHKTPWLTSANPRDTFFDLNNVAFSHLSCNSRASSTVWQREYSDEERASRKQERNARRYTAT